MEDGQNLSRELDEAQAQHQSRSKYMDTAFKRVHVAPPAQAPPFTAGFDGQHSPHSTVVRCIACSTVHIQGSCPLKVAGLERCGLCGQAHYGAGFRKACTHLHSIEQCQLMLEALKSSHDASEAKSQVKKYLVGIIGNLRHEQKVTEEKKRESLQQQQQQRQQRQPPAAVDRHLYSYPSGYQVNGAYMSPYHMNGIDMGTENEGVGEADS